MTSYRPMRAYQPANVYRPRPCVNFRIWLLDGLIENNVDSEAFEVWPNILWRCDRHRLRRRVGLSDRPVPDVEPLEFRARARAETSGRIMSNKRSELAQNHCQCQ